MTDKKTPGPWEAKTFVDNRKHGGDHHTFLITPQRGTYGTMFEEDAILAASAPELLEALKWMVDNDDTNEGDVPLSELGGETWSQFNAYWLDGLSKARAAIAKAEGKK